MPRTRQNSQCRQFGSLHVHAIILDALQVLPVKAVESSCIVGMTQGTAAIFALVLELRQWRRQVLGSLRHRSLFEVKVSLLHEAADVTLIGIARLQLGQFRQKLVFERRPRSGHRFNRETNDGCTSPWFRG
jgi:hypothetical protein